MAVSAFLEVNSVRCTNESRQVVLFPIAYRWKYWPVIPDLSSVRSSAFLVL
jgi:hypothetical protein